MAKVKLGLVGFTDKGEWVSNYSFTNSDGETVIGYAANDLVHTDNGIFRSLTDNNITSPDGDTEHTSWQVWLDVSPVTSAVASIKDYLDALQAAGNAFCGFARVNGDADPTPSADFIYGTKKLVQNIGKHLRLCTVKDGVVQHWCSGARLTLATNGDTIAIDGSDGDVMLATDCDLYLLKANSTVSGNEMNCMGVGVVPAYWQDISAKRMKPFAVTPGYTVHCKLSDDVRSCAHSIYNTSVAGSYSTPTAIFNETFKASGNGYPTQSVSALNSIQQAQNKNSDAATNRPYMGFYYEYYELIVALLYAEMGTLNTTPVDRMGAGSTMQDVVSESTFHDSTISANSGVKAITSDGTAYYKGLMSQDEETGESASDVYDLDALVGGDHYGFREMLETQRICDKIVAAGLEGYIGSSANIFTEDTEGNMTVITDGSVDLATGSGMTANHKYHVVRNVRDVNGDDLEGLQEGVMTAVVNTYVKMTCKDGVYFAHHNMTGGIEIYKFSSCVYRGFSIPMDGMFKQLCGAHYITGNNNGTYYNKFYCAKSVDDVQPLTNTNGYGDIGTEDTFSILKGLTDVVSVPTIYDWIKAANYSHSLFCFTQGSGGAHTHEVCYLWCGNEMWGYNNGYPAVGKVGVKALVSGCSADNGCASVRSAFCHSAVSYGLDAYAGAFAVPELKMKV